MARYTLVRRGTINGRSNWVMSPPLSTPRVLATYTEAREMHPFCRYLNAADLSRCYPRFVSSPSQQISRPYHATNLSRESGSPHYPLIPLFVFSAPRPPLIPAPTADAPPPPPQPIGGVAGCYLFNATGILRTTTAHITTDTGIGGASGALGWRRGVSCVMIARC